MEFPPTWLVLPEGEFESATPRIDGQATMELLAQVRHTGRILGNFRVSLGGVDRLKVDVDLGAMIPQQAFSGWRYKTQYWLRDIRIRTNMTSSAWVDVAGSVAARDSSIEDEGGAEIPAREFLRKLDEFEEDEPHSASTRWAVTVGEDNLMKLQLQSLPGQAVLLSGKPTLKQ